MLALHKGVSCIGVLFRINKNTIQYNTINTTQYNAVQHFVMLKVLNELLYVCHQQQTNFLET